MKKVGFIFEKVLDFLSLLWYVVVLPEVIKMNVIKELWHGNIIPQEDSRTNSKEMKELLGYMARHHEDLEKTFTEEQKEIFDFLKLRQTFASQKANTQGKLLRSFLLPPLAQHNTT